MPACKITVLKRWYDPELAVQHHLQEIHGPCQLFAEGDEFVVKYIGDRPADFGCDWAWNDLQKVLLTLMAGGDFGQWMREKHSFVACCTDGVKPVVFKLELSDENQ